MPHDVDRRPSGLTRRQLIRYSAVTAAGVAALSASPASAVPLARAEATAAAGTALDGFTRPAVATAPRFRWWWPNGQVDLEQIAAEVRTAARSGFGGLEISDVHHSVKSGLDIEEFGWGGAHWVAAVETALATAEAEGIEIDITLGPSWPAATPNITPQSPAAIKEIAHGSVTLAPGAAFSGALPEPITPPEPGVTERTLIGVHALEIVSVAKTTVLRRASIVDLTGDVTGERLEWTAPATGGSWVLLAYWERGSGQRPEGGEHTDPTSYVVDHFSAAGAQTLIDYWEANLLTDRIKSLLGSVGGSFFEDSLEIETHATIWTPKAREEFQQRMDYDIFPFLPVLVETKEKYLYDYDDIVTTRVRDDFNQVMSDLYTEHHLIPLRDWAHAYGLEYRVQAYGLEQDSIAQAGIVDIPETESLGAKNVDDYRVLASGRDIAGRTLLSCESSAYLNKAYLTTWRNEVLFTLAETFCGGVNQTVLHGFAYAAAPGAAWPGFAAFSPYNGGVGYSEAWGPRMPVWAHLDRVAAAISRTQWVLQQGRPQYDIAFFRQKGWAQTGIGAPWATAAGIPIGWSHGFLNESGLFQESSVLQGGRFAPQGGNYRAIILDIDRFRGSEATMSVRAGEALLALAEKGLPLVFFGDWSAPASTGYRDDATNRRVAELIAQMRALPNVADAAGNDDIPVALDALGVGRTVSHASSTLKHIHRVDDGNDYFYFVNAKHNPAKDRLALIEQEVTVIGASDAHVPYALDAWTGAIRPIANYRRNGAAITLALRLQPAQSTVIVLAPAGWAGTTAPRAVVVESSGDDVSVAPDGAVYLHATRSGPHSVRFASGREKQTLVPALPEPLSLTEWSLSLDDWQPAADGVATQHVTHRVERDALGAWSQIGFAEVAGIGDYRTSFALDASWRPGTGGVRLSLGQVLDTFRVWVNSVPVDQVDLTDTDIDISAYVRLGRNTLRVEVASPLINRLRVVTPAVYGVVAPQAYGLSGPVSIAPFGKARVA
ncbi:glycosyl hydrolase [Leucobacter chromiiresistens]|uniref:Alpha-L-rhamnosidase n=1 Tax=Leucobacter chromiiresistens TaxID=1079994 RepID=A0A147EQ09_9MICO|nr:glycosyl hydrolase [Leucobacter chromiiresistens]KTR86541.1 hypothetical protein NS354_03815 [Leucobacter chromiiresistens]